MVEVNGTDTQIINLLMQCNSSGVTRGFICFHTNLARTTAYDHLKRLMGRGVVEKYSKIINEGKGRPYVFWRLKE